MGNCIAKTLRFCFCVCTATKYIEGAQWGMKGGVAGAGRASVGADMPTDFENCRDTPPTSIAILLQKHGRSWPEVVYSLHHQDYRLDFHILFWQ